MQPCPVRPAQKKNGILIFHAAALDRRGSTKGGEFSHGTFPAGGQFGRITINEIGDDQLEVTFTGFNHDLKEILTQTVFFKLKTTKCAAESTKFVIIHVSGVISAPLRLRQAGCIRTFCDTAPVNC